MCKAAQATIGALMSAIEPDLIDLLTFLNVADTPQGQEAINAYNTALAAVQNWVPGTDASEVIQLITAFTAILDTLPIPADALDLINIIAAALKIVIGVLTGNSPAAPDAASQKKVRDAAIAQVTQLVPDYKESFADKFKEAFDDPNVAANEYKRTWKNAVKAKAKADPKYAVLMHEAA
jgi:hypothetical protein